MLKSKGLILVEKAILRIRIKFAALFSRIKTNVNVKTRLINFFSSKATKFEKKAIMKCISIIFAITIIYSIPTRLEYNRDK